MSDICARKHRGSPESIAAFGRIEGHIAREQALVFSTLARHKDGLTAQEVEEILELSCCSVSARMAELKKSGAIVRKLAGIDQDGRPVYLRRRTRSGCSAGVYVVKEEPDGS
jgi:predicted ArsR family transcriptional regulator